MCFALFSLLWTRKQCSFLRKRPQDGALPIHNPEVKTKCLTQRFSVKSKPLSPSLVDTLQSASAGVFVDYKGITVAEDTALRA